MRHGSLQGFRQFEAAEPAHLAALGLQVLSVTSQKITRMACFVRPRATVRETGNPAGFGSLTKGDLPQPIAYRTVAPIPVNSADPGVSQVSDSTSENGRVP